MNKLTSSGVFIILLLVILLAGCAAPPESSVPVPVSVTSTTGPPPQAAASPMPLPTQTLAPLLTAISPKISASATPAATPSPSAIPVLRLAVIGDFGLAGQPLADVADRVLGWQPDYILTTGDNNYPDGEQETIDANVGQYFHSYIFPYMGSYGEGAIENRFFPVLGNHDWNTPGAQPYLDYFTLPGNERYYDVPLGAVHLFMLDSDSREPDGVGRSGAQAAWLQQAMAASTAPWKLVIMHHPPFSSGYHGPVDWMEWPFAEWGASAVLAGHDHTYERLQIDGIPYFINGLGGGPIYAFNVIDEASQVRYNEDYGAMLIDATPSEITFTFSNRSGQEIDRFSLAK